MLIKKLLSGLFASVLFLTLGLTSFAAEAEGSFEGDPEPTPEATDMKIEKEAYLPGQKVKMDTFLNGNAEHLDLNAEQDIIVGLLGEVHNELDDYTYRYVRGEVKDDGVGKYSFTAPQKTGVYSVIMGTIIPGGGAFDDLILVLDEAFIRVGLPESLGLIPDQVEQGEKVYFVIFGADGSTAVALPDGWNIEVSHKDLVNVLVPKKIDGTVANGKVAQFGNGDGVYVFTAPNLDATYSVKIYDEDAEQVGETKTFKVGSGFTLDLNLTGVLGDLNLGDALINPDFDLSGLFPDNGPVDGDDVVDDVVDDDVDDVVEDVEVFVLPDEQDVLRHVDLGAGGNGAGLGEDADQKVRCTDLKDDVWEYEVINKLIDDQLYPVQINDGAATCRSVTAVKRKEFTAWLLQAYRPEIVGDIDDVSLDDIPFSDVDADDPYAKWIVKAAELEIINGYPDGTFGPDLVINRAEVLKILLRSSQLFEARENQIDELLQLYADSEPKLKFSDSKDEEAWFYDYLWYGTRKGIIKGYEDGTAKMGQGVKYNEAAKILYISKRLQAGLEVDLEF
ncbi:S-layer homology domain-containing protein [Candidatus Peregrinibacteria bacterium]|nr:S-layer homology domain-containing protein [Candidatus Peregrinibacteria bacterium]